MLIWLFIVIAALAGLLYALDSNAAILNTLSPGIAAVFVIAVLLAAYLFSARTRGADNRSPSFKWFAAGLVLASIAAGIKALDLLPNAATHTANEAPSHETVTTTNGPAAIRIRKRADGAFIARGTINGSQADFLVDSGASAIMLKPSDAQKAGIDISGLAYDTPLQTAGGAVYVAPVRLRSVAIGPLALDDLEAFVARPGSLNENLLGQNFLRRLTSYEVTGDFITLRK